MLVPLFLFIITELGSLSQTQSYVKDLKVLRTISVMVDFGASCGKRHVCTPRKENIGRLEGQCLVCHDSRVQEMGSSQEMGA